MIGRPLHVGEDEREVDRLDHLLELALCAHVGRFGEEYRPRDLGDELGREFGLRLELTREVNGGHADHQGDDHPDRRADSP
jgi:ATP phosphoribosyltransferase regulatory subunit HisZ